MMKMNDWWSKKLAGEKPTAPRQQFTHPVTQVPVQPTTQAPVTQTPQQQPAAQPESFSEALRMGVTNGGEAARRDTMTCPACGGGYVFSRTKATGGTTVGGNAPAPRCYTCGWNGIYHQGDEANWG
jgi:hypothetical protein